MKICSVCNTQSKVADSRIMEDNNTRRRYRCSCGNSWSTVELKISEYIGGSKSASDRLQADFHKQYGSVDKTKIREALDGFLKELNI